MLLSKEMYFLKGIAIMGGFIMADIRDMKRSYPNYKKWSKSRKYKFILLKFLKILIEVFLLGVTYTLL